jgi:uncharacterized protein YcnI
LRRIRPLVPVLVALVVVVAWAVPASAHVTVSPDQAVVGQDATFSFSVPNEMDNANTVQVQLFMPTDHPIPSVSVEPAPGWTDTVVKTTLPKPVQTDDGPVTEAVSEVTWAGGTIKPGEFQRFTISAGPLPSADQIEFKALQTYSNGQVVRWIQDTPKGGPEPDNPAPVVTLVKGSAQELPASATTAASSSASTSDGTARALGIVGIVLGALGVLAAGITLLTRRRTT